MCMILVLSVIVCCFMLAFNYALYFVILFSVCEGPLWVITLVSIILISGKDLPILRSIEMLQFFFSRVLLPSLFIDGI
jgi:hypothetical protein